MRCISWARLSGALLLGAGIVKAEFAMLSADNSLCPIPCEGTIPGDWTVYHSVDSLSHCQGPMMFDFSVMNPLDDPETIVQIRACTVTKAVKPSTKHVRDAPAVEGQSISRAQSAWWLPTVERQHVSVSIEKIQARALSRDPSSDQGNMFFIYLNGTVVGIYIGALVDVDSSISALSDAANIELRVPVNTPKAASRRFITYKMRDEEGFYEALLANHGTEKDWVEWKDYADHDICICPNGPHARDVDEKEPNRFAAGPICSCEARAGFTMHKNYPRRIQDTSKIDVPNPKAIMEEAIPKTGDLAELLYETYMDSLNEDLDASGSDAVTAFSMPVFMLEDAIKSIKSVKEIGEKQKETKTRELVLGILSIVFAVIPFAGTAASALGGAAMIARAALIIGEAGSAALSIVDIVDDPASAPFAILGMLIGSKGVKVKGPRKAFKDAADARRALKGDKLEAFSPEFRRKDAIVQDLVKKSKSCSAN